jgi:hypothetical protein
MEGRLVSRTFERLLSQSEFEAEVLAETRKAIKFAEEIMDGLGFCLSEKPDTLSQWRGYADDGRGFSIGFTKEYLEELAKAKANGRFGFLRLDKVLYEDAEHEAALRPAYDQIKSLVDSGKFKTSLNTLGMLLVPDKEHESRLSKERSEAINNLYAAVVDTFPSVHMLKNKAFSEEAEWRLVSYLARKNLASALFRPSIDRLIPYREFELEPLSCKSIAEVYVGPKNITPSYVIENFLALNGYTEVLVKRSAASYR